jgi:hypothetical protein
MKNPILDDPSASWCRSYDYCETCNCQISQSDFMCDKCYEEFKLINGIEGRWKDPLKSP